MTCSYTDTVIAHPPLRNQQNLPEAMVPPLLNHQKSSLLNKLSESDHTPTTCTLVLLNTSSGDQNIALPKASSDENVPQHQKANTKIARMFMEGIVFTKNP